VSGPAPDSYDDDDALAQSLCLHHLADDGLDWPELPAAARRWPDRLVALGRELLDDPRGCRVLDLGCGTGGVAFGFATLGADALGIDASPRLIDAARRLAAGETQSCRLPIESGRGEPRTIQPHAPPAAPGRVRFEVGDALTFDVDRVGGPFDLVVAANLLCRISDPARLLTTLGDLVRPGGGLLLATPASWLDRITPRDRHPGDTDRFVEMRLAPTFTRCFARDECLVVRQHARLAQLIRPRVTGWRR